MKSFDAVAPLYDAFMSFWGLYSPGRIAGRAGRGGLLIDLCGGTGYLGLRFTGDFTEVIVADSSAKMLARASARGLKTVLCDGAAVPLPDGCADAVLISDALHHVRDGVSLLAEARRLLKRGGRLVLRDFNADRALVRFLVRFESLLFGPLRFYRPREAAGLAERAGFTRSRIELQGKYFLLVAEKP